MLHLKKHITMIVATAMIATALIPASVQAAASGQKSFNSMYADVSFDLLAKTAKNDQNVLISPTSILAAVSMVENGAAGKTRNEMENMFGGLSTNKTTSALSDMIGRLSGNRNGKFSSPCSVWYKKGEISLKKAYTRKLQDVFNASVVPAAFDTQTVSDINSWVKKATNKKIDRIIDRLDPMDRVILVNATYFKGDWAEPYDVTGESRFTSSGGSAAKVPMMYANEREYFEVNGAKAFVKKYRGGKFAFVAILPPKGMSVRSFVRKTSGSDVLKAYKKRQTSGVVVQTRVPKFKYSFESSLRSPLTSLGMKTAFTEKADFSNMTKKQVYVDDVLHKTHIDLNEKGTEAAAVTAVVMKAGAFPTKDKVRKVYLNRPFLYEIVEAKTGLPIFAGIVNNL